MPTKLAPKEHEDNAVLLLEFLTEISNTPEDQEFINQLNAYFLKLINDNNITLTNLTTKEREEFRKILSDAFNLKLLSEDAFNTWKNSLQNAVYGQGQLIEMHAAVSTGFVSDLRNTGKIPSTKWATDLDIQQCLHHVITLPNAVKKPGSYILPSRSLTERFDENVPFEMLLAEVLETIKNKNIKGEIRLGIPTNRGDNHWRFAEIHIKEGKINRAILHESGGNVSESDDRAYINFKAIIGKFNKNIKPKIICHNSQKDGHSCGDYTMFYAYKMVLPGHSIAKADPNDATNLRLKIVKQIIQNHNQFDNSAAEKLTVQNGCITLIDQPKLKEQPIQQEDIESFQSTLNAYAEKKETVEYQILADSIFARYLDALYADPKLTKQDETTLVNQALEKAMKDIGDLGIFAHSKKAPAPINDASNNDSKKLKLD